MNYRHAFHAGNFADVLKHAVLALCVSYLKEKPAPFRVMDTHAGIGRYDLAGIEAGKTLEWIDGVGRLLGIDAPSAPPDVAPLLEPYLDIVRKMNRGGALSLYPGSPMVARALLRPEDRLVVNELHPQDNAALAALFKDDAQVKVMAMDGWTAVRALTPPPERRGLLLIDPPFEAPGEFDRLAQGLADARKRFATGVMVLWYPVKDLRAVEAFYERIDGMGEMKSLRAELFIRAPADGVFSGCGLLVVNPPWKLKAQLEKLGPFLADRMAKGPGARFMQKSRGD